MRTVRSSSHLLGGVPGPRGCTWSRGVYLVMGVYLVLGGVPGPGGCTWSREGCTWQGVYLVPGGIPGPGGYLPMYSPLLWTDTHM